MSKNESIEQKAEIARENFHKPSDVPEAIKAETEHAVNSVAGPQMDSAQSFASAREKAVHREDHPSRSTKSVENADGKRREAMELLDGIIRNGNELARINLEHRTPDARDFLPVLSNLRSHALAKREAKLIEDIKTDVWKLITLAESVGFVLDTETLSEAVSSLSAPEGWSMIAGSILPFYRHFHRMWTVTRNEEVVQSASNLHRALRQSHSVGQEAA